MVKRSKKSTKRYKKGGKSPSNRKFARGCEAPRLVKAKAKKEKPPKIDGLSPKDKQKIRNAIRQIWHRSHPRKVAVARAIGPDGFPVCEQCRLKSPKLFVDHIKAVGLLDGGFIERMFCPSARLKNLCKECHSEKTKSDNKRLKMRQT